MAVNLSALQVMQDAPVIPVIVLHDVAHAVPMARALVAGGIRMLEVTLRTPQALACMEAIAKEVPEAVVGAGTVRSAADAAAAAKAGAQFAVSPGYTRAVGLACRDGLFLGTPYATPGRHGLVARYATAGGDPVALVGHFYLLPGGSADGAVTALRPVRRPEAEYVLYSTDGGVLARGRNPR